MYTGSAFWSVCIKEVVEEFGVPEVVAQLGLYQCYYKFLAAI